MNRTTSVAYIGLGSNLGDRRQYLLSAIEKLHMHPEIQVAYCSSVYETAPVGYTEQPHFLNMAIAVRTTLEPEALLQALLDTEHSLGRVRDVRWGPRTIDLDLLMYDEVKLHSERLALPHPRIRERAFVLIPLLELCESAENRENAVCADLRRSLSAVDGKEEVQLWEKTSWRSESGRFAN